MQGFSGLVRGMSSRLSLLIYPTRLRPLLRLLAALFQRRSVRPSRAGSHYYISTVNKTE